MQRIHTPAQFKAVLAGMPVARTAHFALHRTALDAQHAVPHGPDGTAQTHPPTSSLGAVVPKRWAKRAVTRNAVKRQIYAVSQSFASQLPPAAYVVRLRAGFAREVFPSASSPALKTLLRTELQSLMQRAAVLA